MCFPSGRRIILTYSIGRFLFSLGICAVAFVASATDVVVAAVEGDATTRIQAAIDECFLAGGGTVSVAAGEYEVRAIRLRSNVTLLLKCGARLLASRNPQDYDSVLLDDRTEPVDTSSLDKTDSLEYGSTNHWNNGIIRIYRAHDVAIVGESGSEIDGRNCFDKNGEETFRGPHAISAHFVDRLTLRGYTVRNSANWAHRICLSKNILIENVAVRGGHDGIDFHACDHALVRNCDIQSGDDCIAGYDIHDLTVRNCSLNSSCSIFRIGGRKILCENLRVNGPGLYCHRSTLPRSDLVAGAMPAGKGRRNTLSFFTYYGSRRARGDSGDIVFRDCRIEGVDRFMHYNFSGSERWQVGSALESVTFERVSASGVKMPVSCYGTEECPLSMAFNDCCISFDGVHVEFLRGANVREVTAKSLVVRGVSGLFMRTWNGTPSFKLDDVMGVEPKTEKATGEFKVKSI